MIGIQLNDLDYCFSDIHTSKIKRKLSDLDNSELPIIKKKSSINNNFINYKIHDDIMYCLNNYVFNDTLINNVWSFCGIKLKKEFLKQLIEPEYDLNNDNDLFNQKITEINDLHINFKSVISHLEKYFTSISNIDFTKSNPISELTNLTRNKYDFNHGNR